MFGAVLRVLFQKKHWLSFEFATIKPSGLCFSFLYNSTKKMQPITSREYKVMLDHLMFRDLESDLQQFSLELASRLKLLNLEVSGSFEKVKRRRVRFLDTKGQGFL